MARPNKFIRRALVASQQYRLARKRLSDATCLQRGDLIELSAIEHIARNNYYSALRDLRM